MYELTVNGKVITRTNDWNKLMANFKVLRKQYEEPISFRKVEESEEKK